MPPLRLLVTGPPRTGKSTLCSAVHAALSEAGCNVDGFLVYEQVDGRNKRTGFEAVSLDGQQRAPLATIAGPQTGYTVGRYNVQVDAYAGLTLPILERVITGGARGPRVCIFDEIGKMEMFSKEFTSKIRQLLENPDPDLHVLGTVAMAGGGFIAQSKRLRGIEVVEIDVSNRDATATELSERFLLAAGGSGGAGRGPTAKSPPKREAPAASDRFPRRRWQPKIQVQAGAAGVSPPSEGLCDADSNAFAFGKGTYGQLGRVCRSSGDVCAVPGVSGAVAGAGAGFDHSVLLGADGVARLLGKNHRGQCSAPSRGGRGDKDPADTKEDVLRPGLAAGIPESRRVTTVVCGGEHTLALLDGGEVWACGDNSSGQLGLGAGAGKFSATFRKVISLGSAEAISAGFKHSSAICGNKLYCWGAGNQGQLGLGGRHDASEPTLVELGSPVKLVALGRWHSLVAANNGVWAFGWGRFGVLGQGETNDHRKPVRIEGLGVDGESEVHELVSGAVHCGAIVGSRRRLMVWGRGALGRLGLGNEANALRPTEMPGLEGLQRLALGGDFSAVRGADASWFVWGKNEEGQLGLGDDDRANRNAPTKVPALHGFDRVILGDCHTVAFR